MIQVPFRAFVHGLKEVLALCVVIGLFATGFAWIFHVILYPPAGGRLFF